MTEKLEFNWDDTGKLEIGVDGNRSATLRYEVSPKVVQETLAKFTKNTANQDSCKSNKTTYPNCKNPKNRQI